MASSSLGVKAKSSPRPTGQAQFAPLPALTFRPLSLAHCPTAIVVPLLFLQHARPSLIPGPSHLLFLQPGTPSPRNPSGTLPLFTQVLSYLSPPHEKPSLTTCLKQAPISPLSNLLQSLLHCSSQHLPLWVSYFIFIYCLPNSQTLVQKPRSAFFIHSPGPHPSSSV